MRRTRHVALPVRAWQYVGLLIVSLACLTLGLVSRDKEGRAGSLAGPELEHRAPHEVDACPNLGSFTKMPFCSNLGQGQTMVLKSSDDEARSFGTRLVRTGNGMSRSRSLDRLSRVRVQFRRDFRSAERLSRQGTTGGIIDPAIYRLSRSLNLDDARSLDRGSRSTVRTRQPVATDLRKNPQAFGRGTTTERRERASRLDDRFDVRDRGPRSVERREATSDRRAASENRLQVRGRRSRSLERRVEEKRDSIGEDRQRSRMDRRVEDRRSSPVRAVRDSRLNPEEARRNLRSVVDEGRNSRYAAASRDQDRRSVRSMEKNPRQMDSGPARSSERTTVVSRAGRQASRSLDRENSRVSDDSDRRSAKRSTDMDRRRESSRPQSRAREASRERKSLARSRTVRSTDSRRERNMDRRNRAQLTTRRDFRLDLDRITSARFERREVRSERRERMNRLDRRLDARSIEKRDSSLARSLERTRTIDSLGRRERTTSRLNLAQETRESRIRLARTSEDSKRDLEQRGVMRDLSSYRRSERRTLVDSRRSSEMRSTVSMYPNHEQVKADRRQIQQRIDRRDLDSRRSIGHRIVEASQLQITRATGPANGVRLSREQRLTDRIHLPPALPRSRSLNDVKRSDVVDPDLARLSGSAARLSRVPSANARLFASRAKISGVPGILNQEHSVKDGLTFEVIRQAIVIGLCAVHGLSMFQGKRYFISNVVRQAPRFVVW